MFQVAKSSVQREGGVLSKSPLDSKYTCDHPTPETNTSSVWVVMAFSKFRGGVAEWLAIECRTRSIL